MRKLVVSLLLFCSSVPLWGQLQIEPDPVDFGDVGVSLLGMDYGQGFIVRNVSDSMWTIEDIPKQPRYPGETYNFGISFEWRVGYTRLLPGDSVRLLVNGSVGSLEWEYGGFMDTAWIPAISESGVRDTFEFFVRANVVKQDGPSISTSKGATVYKCRCGIRDELPVNSTEYRARVFINNPTEDTVWIDSLQLTNLDGVGWWFTDVVNSDSGLILTYDSIGRKDIRYNTFPRSHRDDPPTYILPGMPAVLSAGMPAYKGTGIKATVVDAWLHGKNGEAWYVQDTMKGWIEELPHAVPVSSFSETVTLWEGVDVIDRGTYAYFHKCKLPDSIPVYVEEVEIRGPRADAIRLISNGGAPIPELPMEAECVGGDLTWGIEVRRTPELLGLTVDTVVAHWYYIDPIEGRVEGEAHGLIYTTIEGTSSVAGEEGESVNGRLVVRPNPVGDVLDLQWVRSGVQGAERVRFVLYDELGREAVRFGADRTGRGMLQVTGLPAGTYIAVAYDEGGRAIGAEKVVKE